MRCAQGENLQKRKPDEKCRASQSKNSEKQSRVTRAKQNKQCTCIPTRVKQRVKVNIRTELDRREQKERGGQQSTRQAEENRVM